MDTFSYNICNENKLIIINKDNVMSDRKNMDLFKVKDDILDKYAYYFNNDNVLNMDHHMQTQYNRSFDKMKNVKGVKNVKSVKKCKKRG